MNRDGWIFIGFVILVVSFIVTGLYILTRPSQHDYDAEVDKIDYGNDPVRLTTVVSDFSPNIYTGIHTIAFYRPDSPHMIVPNYQFDSGTKLSGIRITARVYRLYVDNPWVDTQLNVKILNPDGVVVFHENLPVFYVSDFGTHYRIIYEFVSNPSEYLAHIRGEIFTFTSGRWTAHINYHLRGEGDG